MQFVSLAPCPNTFVKSLTPSSFSPPVTQLLQWKSGIFFLRYSVALSKMLLQSRALSMFDGSLKAIAHYYGMFYAVQLLSLEHIPTAEHILC